MTIKPLDRHALKLIAVCVAGLLVGIGLGMLLVLTTSRSAQKEVVLVTAVSEENTEDLPALAEKESDYQTKGVVSALNETALTVSKSETEDLKARSLGGITSAPATAESPEQLVYYAETAFAEDLTVAEKLAALRSLENIDDPMVVDPVMIAMDDPDSDLRIAALEVLRDREYDEVNEVFIAGLEDDNQDVTDKVMDILADSDSPNILPSLEQALMDSDEKVQKTAIVTLEDIEDVRAVDMLLAGLLNNEEAIRKEAFDSIEFITDQRFENYEDAKMWWELNREIFEFE